jgi:hypothetical protein
MWHNKSTKETMNESKPRRLTLKDEGAVKKIQDWWKYIQQEWKEVIDWCGFAPGSDLEKTAYFMMMGFMTQDTRHIKIVMPNCSREWLQFRRERARKYGIWCGNRTLRAEWFNLADKKDMSAEVSFLVNVMVINGDMEVVKQYNHKTGKYERAYRLSKEGLVWARQLLKEPERLPRPSKKELDRYADDENPNG